MRITEELATKGTKSTKGIISPICVPFVFFVPFVAIPRLEREPCDQRALARQQIRSCAEGSDTGRSNVPEAARVIPILLERWLECRVRQRRPRWIVPI